MKGLLRIAARIFVPILLVGFCYVITLLYPQPFFRHHITDGVITVYSDEEIPVSRMTAIIQSAQNRIQKSILFKSNTKHSLYFVNNPIRWRYFTNINYKMGGINYVCFNHNIFLRKVDINNNRLYGPSGNIVTGNRTLDYFMAHEMTHTLEFQSMPWYQYPIQTNWILEGYAEYIAHESESYEKILDQYLTVSENSGAKYYTKVRTMVAYVLEKEHVEIPELWNKVNEYDVVLKKAIPDDKPVIDDKIGKK
jgi:hypothetical protein